MAGQVRYVGSLAMGEADATKACRDKFISEPEILLANGLVPQMLTRTPQERCRNASLMIDSIM